MHSRPILIVPIVFVAIAAGLVAGPGHAAPRPPREQRMPAVAFNSDADVLDFLLVWVEDRGSGPDVFGKRLFNNGLPQGGPDKSGVQVIRDPNRREPAGPRSDPSLAYSPQQEEYLLVYSEQVGGENGWDVFAVRVNSNGYGVTPPRLVAGGPGDQQRPDVELIAIEEGSGEDRDYLVVFDDNSRDVDEIWAVRVRPNGIPKAKPYTLVTNATSNASDPTTNGGAVAWVDDRAGQTDIWALRLLSGKPNGMPYRLAGDDYADDYAPRYGGTGLVWNTSDPATGADIRGVEVYPNNRVRGNSVGILVPVADQSWPDSGVSTSDDRAQSIVVFADNRSGEYDLYGIRTTNFRRQGREFAIVLDNPAP